MRREGNGISSLKKTKPIAFNVHSRKLTLAPLTHSSSSYRSKRTHNSPKPPHRSSNNPLPPQTLHILLQPLLMLQLALLAPLDLFTFDGARSGRRSFVSSKLVVVLVRSEHRRRPRRFGSGHPCGQTPRGVFAGGGEGGGVFARLGGCVEGDDAISCTGSPASTSGGFEVYGRGGSVDGGRCLMTRMGSRECIFRGRRECCGRMTCPPPPSAEVEWCLVGSAHRAASSQPISNLPKSRDYR
jgi:hypothetical protein